MSKRPVSVDELLKEDFEKPQYIPKSKRSKATGLVPTEKPPIVEKPSSSSSWRRQKSSEKVLEPQVKHNEPNKKLARRKFQFDWDESEDTTITTSLTSRPLLSFLDDEDRKSVV